MNYEYEFFPNQFEKRAYVKNYSFGQYKNNKKIGRWSYIYNGGDYTYEAKSEEYLQDGSVKRIENGEKTITSYSPDSSRINSITVFSLDTICIDCSKKSKITFPYCKMTFKKSVIKTFSKDKFEEERENVLNGFYLREVRLIKNNIH